MLRAINLIVCNALIVNIIKHVLRNQSSNESKKVGEIYQWMAELESLCTVYSAAYIVFA